MKGHCKKCGWPWHGWYGAPTFCEHCFEDPRTEHQPIVLFDEIGRPEGCGQNLRVQLKKGCDPDRLQSGIRERVFAGRVVHCETAFPRIVSQIYDTWVSGKARTDLEVDRGGERRIVVLAGDRSGSQIFEEDEFLELFEPVRYERFWREGEDYEPVLKPGHYPRIYPLAIPVIKLRVETTEIVPKERKLTGKVFLLEHQYNTNHGSVLCDDHPLGEFKCYADLISENLPLIHGDYRSLANWSDWVDEVWTEGIWSVKSFVNGHKYMNEAGLDKRPSKGMMATALLAVNNNPTHSLLIDLT